MMPQNTTCKEASISIGILRQLSNKIKDPVYFSNLLFSLIRSSGNITKFELIIKSRLSSDDFLLVLQILILLSRKPSELEKLMKSIVSDEFVKTFFEFLNNSCKENSNPQIDDILVTFFEYIINYLPECKKTYKKVYTLILETVKCLKQKNVLNSDDELYERLVNLFELIVEKQCLLEKINSLYTEINILPSVVDLFKSRTLSPSIIKGPYKDTEQYLDINFKLLKEDFSQAIKEGFEFYRCKEQANITSESDFFIYRNVMSEILFLDSNPQSRICHRIQFSAKDRKKLTKEDWDISKKFMKGSLVFFSFNDFKTFCAATVEKYLFALTMGLVKAIKVSVVGNPYKIKVNRFYDMAEPRVFFEPYYQSLKMLQGISPNAFPMADKVISVNVENKRSQVLSKSFFTSSGRVSYIGNDLNKSQVKALNGALSNKFTLIQGPPGTGKTYLTRKVISILAADRSNQHPILVVCSRNKALDLILEPLVVSGLKVVRIGRTKNKILEEGTLYNLQRTKFGRPNEKISECLREKIRSFREIINDPKNINKPKAVHEAFQLHTKASNAYRLHTDYFYAQKLLCMDVEVIGATTTGAAKFNAMLSSINPKAVIIEEAAEILEPFLISSLPASCDHLILIGDHLQLQPITSSYSSVKYNLNISFFERMVMNGMTLHQLDVQHRMRPEIAEVVFPLIYGNIKNHSSVHNFADVQGVAKNVFFINHSFPESFQKKSKSVLNYHEADFLLSFANYLVKQGYSPEDITILAAYSAQQYYLSQISGGYPLISGITIQSIDNYQGDENYIILVSLVRSKGPTIGFLSKSNRINVALTRARMGLYMIGNMKNLSKHSTIWTEINCLLKKTNSIGNKIPLKCKTHENIKAVEMPVEIDELTQRRCRKHYCLFKNEIVVLK